MHINNKIFLFFLLLIASHVFSQKRVNWKDVVLHEMTSDKPEFNENLKKVTNSYGVGEGFVKIKAKPKKYSDLNEKQLDKIKKKLAKENAIEVFIDVAGYVDKNGPSRGEYYCIYSALIK
jgi:hypothetical protein